MKKYILTGVKIDGGVDIYFNAQGLLCKLDMERVVMSKVWVKGFKEKLPISLEDFLKMDWLSSDYSIIEGSVEISFEMFWKKYEKKINKARAMPLWAKLSAADQVQAYCGIEGYDAYLKKTGWREKVDPENFIKRRMWENEYQ